jgi:hypothetical protein
MLVQISSQSFHRSGDSTTEGRKAPADGSNGGGYGTVGSGGGSPRWAKEEVVGRNWIHNGGLKERICLSEGRICLGKRRDSLNYRDCSASNGTLLPTVK